MGFKKSKLTTFFLAVIFIGLVACGERSLLEVKDYVSYVLNPENGLQQKLNLNGIEYEALYEPLPYTVLKQNKSEKISKDFLKKQLSELDSLKYVVFKIRADEMSADLLKKSSASPEEYYGKVEYLTSKVQNDFSIVCGVDTFPCIFSHYEPVSSVTPYVILSLVFKSNKSELSQKLNDNILVYNDQLWGAGKLNIVFKKEDINKVPDLHTY